MFNITKIVENKVSRRELNISRLAEFIGVNRVTIYRVLSGERNNLAVRGYLAGYLGLSMRDAWAVLKNKNESAEKVSQEVAWIEK